MVALGTAIVGLIGGWIALGAVFPEGHREGRACPRYPRHFHLPFRQILWWD